MLLKNHVAVVTGGNRGIGKEIVLLLAKNGCKVAINYHKDFESAKQTLKAITDMGCDGLLVQGDVSNPDDVSAFMDKIIDTFGKIDILVNNE